MGEAHERGRGFREVDIAITSVQPGVERLSGTDPGARGYPAFWRNNLTALSQHANLFFVGILDEIQVYQPDFPTQRLPKRIFTWRVATSGYTRRGFISPSNPHWINRLTVGDCGTEEVIATAHDEGDFIVCTVRSVCQAIQAARSLGLKAQDAADLHIKYLCRKNVEQSAWGIAIHQKARLLAVSANTRNITVLAPALMESHQGSPPTNIACRTEDKLYVLSGHEANIPAIAFCNTGDDPDGRFLVSTDINGGIIIWDIWKQCGLKKIAMSVGPEDAHLLGEHFLGWSVTCVNPRSFHAARTDVEFVGFNRHNAKRAATTIDISPARKHLRDFQFWHETEPRRVNGRERTFHHPSRGSPSLSEDDTDEDDFDDEDEDEDMDEEDDEEEDIDEDFEPEDNMLSDLGHGDWYDAVDFGPSPPSDEATNTEELSESSGAAGTSESAPSLPITNALPPISTMDLPTTSRQPPFAPHSRSAMSRGHYSHYPPPPAPKVPDPEFPFAILHSGQRIVTLLCPPFDAAAAVCIDPCHEHLPSSVLQLGSFERLNLTAYISELSVAILATQKGRAAIFTLTALPSSMARDSNPTSHLISGRRPDIFGNARRASNQSHAGDATSHPEYSNPRSSGSRYAMRLDWVIPFKSQENSEQRPWSPLVGLTVAPVQGSKSAWQMGNMASPLDEEDILCRFGGLPPAECQRASHRWRLLLTYADQTVLSYDLFRQGGQGPLMCC